MLLQSHQRQHNKDKPYKCPNCYRAYSDSASLQIHLSAHAIKHAKAYCCSMCGRAYTSVSPPSPHFPLAKPGLPLLLPAARGRAPSLGPRALGTLAAGWQVGRVHPALQGQRD